jgi:hypothetical protein
MNASVPQWTAINNIQKMINNDKKYYNMTLKIINLNN